MHTITGGGGTAISISPGLQATGGSLQALDYGLSLDTRPEVALLTRSITIRGVPQCRVLVSHLFVNGNDFRGSLDLSNVRVNACGSDVLNAVDIGTGVTLAQEPCDACPPGDADHAGSATIVGSVISDSKTGGVFAVSAISLIMQDSAVIGTVGTAVDVRSPLHSPTITGTLVMNAMSATSNPQTQETACFSICSVGSAVCVAASLKQNVCAGSANAGFLVYAVACGDLMPYAENTAHHALVGVLIHGRWASCVAASGFAAYECSEVGIPSLYGQRGYNVRDIRLSGMVVKTSGVGFTGGFMCPVGSDCSFSLANSVALSGGSGSVGFRWNEFFNGASVHFPRDVPVQVRWTLIGHRCLR